MNPFTKFLLLIAGIIIIAGLFIIRNASNSSKVEIDYGTSNVYTKKDMDDAVKVIKRKFRRMKGFDLARSDGGKWRIISGGY